MRALVMLRVVFTPETRTGSRSLRFDAFGTGWLDLPPDRDTLRSHGQDGTCAVRTTFSATDPNISRSKPVRP